MQTLRGVVSSRSKAATPNLKTVEALLLSRTGLPNMAPGTLNVTIPFNYIVHADATIEPHEYFTGERLKLQRCRVRGHRMIIMRPESHEQPGSIGASVLEPAGFTCGTLGAWPTTIKLRSRLKVTTHGGSAQTPRQ